MKYYVIAGEASGDLHASNLIKALKQLDSNFDARGWGGDHMQSAGVNIVKHYRELAFMGFVEVIANLRTILNNIANCKKDITAYQPDAMILVDYPGFNLRIAEFAHNAGIKVFYYISPQVWAWKSSRVHQIKKHVDKMLTILPFESDFYKKFDYHVDFVGHPLLDAINDEIKIDADWERDGRPVIALLPGSRKQEISVMLPVMLKAAVNFKDYRIVVAGAPSQDQQFYEAMMSDHQIEIIFGRTYELLSVAKAAMVTSGTATLETALFKVPEVVCYKGNKLSYYIARQLIKVKFISLVNLVMDREVVKELIQGDMNAGKITKELNQLLQPGEARERLMNDYDLLRSKLGGPGASARAAHLIAESLR